MLNNPSNLILYSYKTMLTGFSGNKDLIDKVESMRIDGEYLNIDATDVQFGRAHNSDSKYSYIRLTLFVHSDDVGTTEKVIAGSRPGSLDITRPASARKLTLASTSTDDTLLGTGARTVQIFGLSASGATQFETINMNGQSEVDSTLSYLRISDMITESTGSAHHNIGIIYCSDDSDTWSGGVPVSRWYHVIQPTHSLGKIGLLSLYHGSAGKVVFERIIINTDATLSKPVTIRIYRTIKELDQGDGDMEILVGTYYLANKFLGDLSIDRFTLGTDEIRITGQTDT